MTRNTADYEKSCRFIFDQLFSSNVGRGGGKGSDALGPCVSRPVQVKRRSQCYIFFSLLLFIVSDKGVLLSRVEQKGEGRGRIATLLI